MKEKIVFDRKGKQKVKVSRMIQAKLTESTKEWKMKSLHEIMNKEINEKYRKGDNVRPTNKKDKFYGKMGVVMRVGTGKTKGAQTVKFPNGEIVSFNNDELEMPKLAEAMNPDDKTLMNKGRAYFKKKYGAKNIRFKTVAGKNPALQVYALDGTKFNDEDINKVKTTSVNNDTVQWLDLKNLNKIVGESLDEYNFNAHARTVSKAKNFKKGLDNTTYNVTYVDGKSIRTEKGLSKSDMVNWVNSLKKSGYKIKGIIDSEGRDAGTQRANRKGVFKESFDEKRKVKNLGKRLVKQFEKRAAAELRAGTKIDINDRLPTVAVDFKNGDEYFFQGQEAEELLDEVPDDINADDYILAIAQNW